MKKLRKAALGYIASNLTQTEVGHLAELFKTMDKNDDGHVSLAELDEAIAKGSFNKEIRDDLREMRHELTLSDEETIDYRDFLAATMDRSLAMREENMKMAFEHFKRSDADYLTLEDFADFFGGEAHAKEILSLLDANGDGKVSFDDFRRVIAESMEDDEDETENGEVIG